MKKNKRFVSRSLWIVLINLICGNIAIYFYSEYGYQQPGGTISAMLSFSFFATLWLAPVLKKFATKQTRLQVMKFAILLAIAVPITTMLGIKLLNLDPVASYISVFTSLKFVSFYILKFYGPPMFMLNLVLLRWLNNEGQTELTL